MYNIYFWFSDYMPWKFASRSNVPTFSLFSIAVWFPYFIFSIYLVLPFVQIFNVESEKVTAHYIVHCSTNTHVSIDQNCNFIEIKHCVAIDGR